MKKSILYLFLFCIVAFSACQDAKTLPEDSQETEEVLEGDDASAKEEIPKEMDKSQERIDAQPTDKSSDNSADAKAKAKAEAKAKADKKKETLAKAKRNQPINVTATGPRKADYGMPAYGIQLASFSDQSSAKYYMSERGLTNVLALHKVWDDNSSWAVVWTGDQSNYFGSSREAKDAYFYKRSNDEIFAARTPSPRKVFSLELTGLSFVSHYE